MSPLYGLKIPLYYKKTPILHTQVIFTFMLYVYALLSWFTRQYNIYALHFRADIILAYTHFGHDSSRPAHQLLCHGVQMAGSGSVLAVAEAACHWFCVTAPSSDWLCVGREEDCCTTNL